MGVTLARKRAKHGFTLVELLVVMTIIGLLVGLTAAAVIAAKSYVKRAAIKIEIENLSSALKAYANEVGDLPPDFAFVSDPNATLSAFGRAGVVRHLRKAFPKYGRGLNDGDLWLRFQADLLPYNLDPNRFDPAAAMVFWLGGLPEDPANPTLLSGFNSDPANPFKPLGTRVRRLYEFKPEQLQLDTVNKTIRYIVPRLETPFVYFRARKDAGTNRYEYGFAGNSPTFTPAYLTYNTSVCRPYLDGNLNTSGVTDFSTATLQRPWRNLESFQIIVAGDDNLFGGPETSDWRQTRTGLGFTSADFDNITNFFEGKLEDEIK